MSKYTVNMSDQLNKVRVNTQEKLKKEAEVVVEIEQPSALQSATADYLSRKEEPHPLGSPKNLNEMKKVEIKLNRGNVDKDIQKIVKHIGLVNKKRRPNEKIKITSLLDDLMTVNLNSTRHYFKNAMLYGYTGGSSLLALIAFLIVNFHLI